MLFVTIFVNFHVLTLSATCQKKTSKCALKPEPGNKQANKKLMEKSKIETKSFSNPCTNPYKMYRELCLNNSRESGDEEEKNTFFFHPNTVSGVLERELLIMGYFVRTDFYFFSVSTVFQPLCLLLDHGKNCFLCIV
jgi:hypothetical protein